MGTRRPLTDLGQRIDAARAARRHSLRVMARIVGRGHTSISEARFAEPSADLRARLEAYIAGGEYTPEFPRGFLKPLGQRLDTARARNNHSLQDVMRITGVERNALDAARLASYVADPGADVLDALEEYIATDFNPPLPPPQAFPFMTNSGLAVAPKCCETTSCENCPQFSACQPIVVAGGLALCEHVIPADLELLVQP